jgi:hypothetical protein
VLTGGENKSYMSSEDELDGSFKFEMSKSAEADSLAEVLAGGREREVDSVDGRLGCEDCAC